jgi:uncharacterized protein (TIGR02271 family)
MTDQRRPDEQGSLIRHEERLQIRKGVEQIGTVRIRKHAESVPVEERIPRGIERAELSHVSADREDSGQVETLPDGSLSIPVFEEELVISRRLVVRERILVKRQTVYQPEVIREELRRERVEIEESPASRKGGKERKATGHKRTET